MSLNTSSPENLVSDELAYLRARVKQLELEVSTKPVRTPIETMDSKVVDSNPYRYVLRPSPLSFMYISDHISVDSWL